MEGKIVRLEMMKTLMKNNPPIKGRESAIERNTKCTERCTEGKTYWVKCRWKYKDNCTEKKYNVQRKVQQVVLVQKECMQNRIGTVGKIK